MMTSWQLCRGTGIEWGSLVSKQWLLQSAQILEQGSCNDSRWEAHRRQNQAGFCQTDTQGLSAPDLVAHCSGLLLLAAERQQMGYAGHTSAACWPQPAEYKSSL